MTTSHQWPLQNMALQGGQSCFSAQYVYFKSGIKMTALKVTNNLKFK
jgi:hypothetical protein